jgi:hypothetical protein
MSLIDVSYFVGEPTIPNTDNPAVAERVIYFIQKYEPIFLQKLLGYPLFKAFTAGISVASPATPDQRYLNILTGIEYTDSSGILQKWKGLVVKTESADAPNDYNNPTFCQKESCIADYIYWQMLKDRATSTSGFGEVSPVSEDAVSKSSWKKAAGRWNQMHRSVCELMAYLVYANTGPTPLYPEWTNTNEIEALRSFKFMNPYF